LCGPSELRFTYVTPVLVTRLKVQTPGAVAAKDQLRVQQRQAAAAMAQDKSLLTTGESSMQELSVELVRR
jgi:hypothetical protein